MSETTFRTNLRGAVRGLWSGSIDFDNFWDMFLTTIRTEITRAWHAGARAGNISPDEMSPEERAELQSIIFNQFGYINNFAVAIEQNSKANGGKLTPLFSRVEYWVQQWQSTYNKALAMAKGDEKLEWVYGDTDHCPQCEALNGKVKRASYWMAHVMPRNPPNGKLTCGGWRCQCSLVPTDKPLSRGPLPFGL